MTTLTVTNSDGNPNSANTGSLGYILAHAADGDVINFAASVTEIELAGSLIIHKNVTIEGDRDGNGTPDVILNRSGSFSGNGPLVEVTGNVDVAIDGFTLENGSAIGAIYGVYGPGAGGAIFDAGTLTLGDCVFSNNHAQGANGGKGSDARGDGGIAGGDADGAIYVSAHGQLNLVRNTNVFSNNSAVAGNGGQGGSGGFGGSGGTGGEGGSAISSGFVGPDYGHDGSGQGAGAGGGFDQNGMRGAAGVHNGAPAFGAGGGGCGGFASFTFGGRGAFYQSGRVSFSNSSTYDTAHSFDVPLTIYRGNDDYYQVNVQTVHSGLPKLTISVSDSFGTDDHQVINFTSSPISLHINFSDNVNTVSLGGYSGDDQLLAGSGNDVLDGGAGADSMIGGAGNDRFYVDNAGDKVFESVSGGADTVLCSVSHALQAGQSVDVLATTSQVGAGTINLAGNDLTQAIQGNNGANIITSGGGADSLYGFDGNDRYNVDNAAERVFETADQGSDTVFASSTYALQNGQSVELLATSAQGGTNAIMLSGNDLAQRINGNEGVNGLYGGGADDSLYGYGGNDRLVGGAGRDVMDGGAGNDVFAYAAVSDSIGVNRDLIQNMNLTAADKFQFTVKPTGGIHAAVTHGTLNDGANFDANLSTAIYDASELGANQAVLFTPDGGSLAHHVFLIVDANGTAGYQAGQDYVIELQNLTGTLTTDDFS